MTDQEFVQLDQEKPRFLFEHKPEAQAKAPVSIPSLALQACIQQWHSSEAIDRDKLIAEGWLR
ncbi:MAG: hypothetical protein IH991_09590 [Planctomycetes bacterium]|nr:hypothetical protein [Planctomycetota bacterium]